MLKSMLQWSKNYDEGKDDLKKCISSYEEKYRESGWIWFYTNLATLST